MWILVCFLTILSLIVIYFSGGRIKKLKNTTREDTIGDNIPKNLMQTIKNKNIPDRLKNYIDLLVKKNKDYSREIYDDTDIENFIKDDPRLMEAYNNIDIGVVKADFFRLVWLLKKGGVYVDIDMIALSPLKYLEDTDMLVLFSEDELIFHFIGAKKNNPIISNTLDMCIENINNKTYLKNYGKNNNGFISKICGPEVYTKAFREYLGIHKFEEKEIEKNNLKIRLMKFNNYEHILKHKFIGWSYYIDTYRSSQNYWGLNFDNVKDIVKNMV